MATSATGRAGSVTYNSQAINITGWNAKVTREYADSTDSSNFDTGTGQIYGSQKPGVVRVEGSIKGNYDIGGTTSTNVTAHIIDDTPRTLLLSLTRSVNWGSMSVDLTDVEISVETPGSTMMTFTANFKSNGVPTFY